MKRTRSSALAGLRRPGYTLVELLVVIGLIAVLASLAFTVTRAVMVNAYKMQTKVMLADIENAVNSYFTDYHRLPLAGAGEEPVRMNQGNDLVAILIGEVAGPGTANPAGRPFLTPRPARNGRNGLIETSGAPPSLVDRWGNPFFIALDMDHDASVPNPDRVNEDGAIAGDAPPRLRQRVAVFSAGPDGKKATRDDIVSWR